MYIYTLIDPETKRIRYVGKTNNPRSRLRGHNCDCRKTHKAHWIKSLHKRGLSPQMDIIEEVDDTSWKEREIYWIAHYKSIGEPLTNISTGGWGGNGIGEKQRGSKNHQWGKPIPEHIKEKIRNALSGSKNPFWGKHHSEQSLEKMRARTLTDEQKKRVSDVHKGKKISDWHKEIISRTHKGKPKSKETKEKMRLAALNQSDEKKKRISAALKGKPKSKEHIENMRKSALNRYKKGYQEDEHDQI